VSAARDPMARKKASRGKGKKARDPHPEDALRELEANLSSGVPPSCCAARSATSATAACSS
jgi:hypothetical protein